MKIAFMSDLHLNFVPKFAVDNLIKEMMPYDMAIIAGDISEAPSLDKLLDYLSLGFNKPIYYIHGNHDAYYGSFNQIYQIGIERNNKPGQLCKWLQDCGIVKLSDNTCLIGHDGFYDCRNGNFFQSDFSLSDFDLIEDLKRYSGRYNLFSLCNRLGDDSAVYIEETFAKAAQTYKNIVFVTHVPPFIEASLYMGKPSSKDALPFFSNKAAGDAIKRFARSYPKINVLCLTGHSHDPAYYKFGNVQTITAGAKYYEPAIYGLFEPK